MGLLLDVFHITGSLLRYEAAQCKQQVNRGVNGCALLILGLGVLLISLVLLLQGLYLAIFRRIGPAAADFITAAGTFVITAALAMSALRIVQNRPARASSRPHR